MILVWILSLSSFRPVSSNTPTMGLMNIPSTITRGIEQNYCQVTPSLSPHKMYVNISLSVYTHYSILAISYAQIWYITLRYTIFSRLVSSHQILPRPDALPTISVSSQYTVHQSDNPCHIQP